MLGQLVGQQVFDEVLLHLTERDDADASFRKLGVFQPSDGLIDDGLCFGAVGACLSEVVGAVYGNQLYLRYTVVHRREGEEFAIVVLGVAKGDEALVARAIMPSEIAGGQRQGDTVVENALHIVDVSLGLVYGVGGEETGGRHLFGVAHADERFSSCDSSHGLAGGHL